MKVRSNSCFTLTEHENLYDRVSHDRLMAIVMQPDVEIHEAVESTISCRTEQLKAL